MKHISEKIREARYFLNCMRRDSRDVEKRDDFRYHLRAFLSSGRAIIFMMRRHYGRKRGFKQWIRQIEDDKYVRFLTQLRDEDIHELPVTPGYVIESSAPTTTYQALSDGTQAVTYRSGYLHWYWSFDRHPEMPEDADPDEWEDEWEWDHGEPAPSREAVDVCREILGALESWVAKATARFPDPSARVASR